MYMYFNDNRNYRRTGCNNAELFEKLVKKRKDFNRVVKETKKSFYVDQIDDYRHDQKKFWAARSSMWYEYDYIQVIDWEYFFIEIVKDFDIHKASGVKGINSQLLIDAMYAIPHVFVKIINMSLITGIFPDDMKVARIAFIPKKGNLKDLKNLRPISLLSIVGKVVEKVVKAQIVNYFVHLKADNVVNLFTSGPNFNVTLCVFEPLYKEEKINK